MTKKTKEVKRIEAEDRAVERSQRTNKQQLDLIDSRRGLSEKERAKLNKA